MDGHTGDEVGDQRGSDDQGHQNGDEAVDDIGFVGAPQVGADGIDGQAD